MVISKYHLHNVELDYFQMNLLQSGCVITKFNKKRLSLFFTLLRVGPKDPILAYNSQIQHNAKEQFANKNLSDKYLK